MKKILIALCVYIILIDISSCTLFPGERKEIFFLDKPEFANTDSIKWIVLSKTKISDNVNKFGFVCYEEKSNNYLFLEYINSISKDDFPDNILDSINSNCKLNGNTLSLELNDLEIGKKYNIFSYYKSDNDQYIKSETFSFSMPISQIEMETSVISSNKIELSVKINHSFLRGGDLIVPDLFIDDISYGKDAVKRMPPQNGCFTYRVETKLNSTISAKKCFKFVFNFDKDLVIKDSIIVNDGLKFKLDDIISLEGKKIRIIIDDNSFLFTKTPIWNYVYYKKKSDLNWENFDFNLDNKIKVESNYPDTIDFLIYDILEYNCDYDFLLYGKLENKYWISEVFNYKINSQKPEIINFSCCDSSSTNVKLKWNIKLNGEPLKNLYLFEDGQKFTISPILRDKIFPNLKPFSKYSFILKAENSVGYTSDTIFVNTKDTIPPCLLTISNLNPALAIFNIQLEKIDEKLRGDNIKGIYLFSSNDTLNPVADLTKNISYKNEKQILELKFNPFWEKRPFNVYAIIENRNGFNLKTNSIIITE